MPSKSTLITSLYDLTLSMEALALWINREFEGKLPRPVVRDDIVAWLKGKNLPGDCPEPFPAKHPSNRFSAAYVRTWVAKWLVSTDGVPKMVQETLPGWKDRIGIAQAEQAERDNENSKREFDTKWMLTTEHTESMQRSFTIFSSKTTRLLETDLPAGHADDIRRILASHVAGGAMTSHVADAIHADIARAIIQRHREAWDALRQEFQKLSTGEAEEVET